MNSTFIDTAKSERERTYNRQASALMDAVGISEEKKLQILDLYNHLQHKHPKWKAHKCLRKAAEWFNVKIDFVQ